MVKVAVAFVDDHPILLDGLSSIFAAHEAFDVVATGASATDALRIASQCKAHVIVLDLSMPGNAFEAIAKISSDFSDTKIIVFTASVGIEHAVRALEAGASGYVIKGSTADELVYAIRSVSNGETFITQSFATKIIAALRNSSARKMAAQAIRLSVREDQIVRLLLRGWTNKEIANHLSISEKTVKHYMSVLMQKLNARNRIEVVLAAQKIAGNSAEFETSSVQYAH